jgi:hypothetical protein
MAIKFFLQIILVAMTFSSFGCQNSDTKNINTTHTNTTMKTDTIMNESIFWKIMERICEMGDFIVATGKDGASANIKGKFTVGVDGKEKVIENIHHDHIHLYPEQLSKFNFTYIDVGYGKEPCIEIINKKNETALKLFYFGGSKKEKFEKFLSDFKEYKHLITGKW